MGVSFEKGQISFRDFAPPPRKFCETFTKFHPIAIPESSARLRSAQSVCRLAVCPDHWSGGAGCAAHWSGGAAPLVAVLIPRPRIIAAQARLPLLTRRPHIRLIRCWGEPALPQVHPLNVAPKTRHALRALTGRHFGHPNFATRGPIFREISRAARARQISEKNLRNSHLSQAAPRLAPTERAPHA